MKVLVTGGGGFIGAWMLRALTAEGYDPVVFDLRDDRRKIAEICGAAFAERVNFIAGDIGDTEAVVAAMAGCEGVVHLAGILTPACQADPLMGVHVNLVGTLNVFMAARRHGIGFVTYMSSAGVYGPTAADEPRPTTHYGAFKLAGEGSARAFLADDGIASIGFRPFVVYGGGRDVGGSAGPSIACREAAQGRPYTIPFTGAFDMIHAGDVASCFMTALAEKPAGAHVVNMVGLPTDPADVAAKIRAVVPDAEIDAAGPPLPVVCPDHDETLARLFPAWRQRSLADGIAETVDFYRAG
ncbi:NAD-dependent epimerase/dehydratase family protein [Acuticoccus yangtzensis]|uniref:NAD-dependent epimerase/dehydratase family protein n=1 Tax=Acuticoccus yangtzensis TaxID=1443441 RepID=UPI0009496E91|nr:SDR family oxidoreductase [Acuticoccus yangtzensis]